MRTLSDILSIDIETYSSVELAKSGVYAYADAPDFAILLFAYAFNDEPVRVIDIASGEELPPVVMSALSDGNIIKSAFNAQFERVCISRYFGIQMPPEQWRCSMVHAAELGLPASLDGASKALGLSEQKDARGRSLIRYFSKPAKVKRTGCADQISMDESGDTYRRTPDSAPEKWEMFKEYCRQDVEVERAIRKRLERFPLPERELRLWRADQRINDRGIRLDVDFARKAVEISGECTGRSLETVRRITGISNPKSNLQMKAWVERETGFELASIDKLAVDELLSSDIPLTVREALTIRRQLQKASVAKYKAMLGSVCSDGRIRGILQFYGANRTGRWAGRIVQPQNLPQNHLSGLAQARECVIDGGYELLDLLYGDVQGVLSELIRTALIPSEGRRFVVSDFSAIEARVLSYLAGEKWRLEVFRNNGDIYCASASQMFRVPVEKHGRNAELRQKGKIAELALGYGGSVGAMVSMGALRMGLDEVELQPIIDKWRASNPSICKFWRTVEDAAMSALRGVPVNIGHGISFQKEAGILFIGLPSGRRTAYIKPEIRKNKFGRDAVTYLGTVNGRTERVETFGGKLVENIVQAFARDCLAEAILRLEERGYEINFHVHDEVIIDAPKGVSSADEVSKIMCEPISWAKGLPLNADGYECEFYKKE